MCKRQVNYVISKRLLYKGPLHHAVYVSGSQILTGDNCVEPRLGALELRLFFLLKNVHLNESE
jgi:hypothetical protein